MGRRKAKLGAPQSTDVAGAVDSAFSEIESIKDELQSWRDGLPENLQNGSKAETLDEAINNLEEHSAPDVPDSASGLAVTYREWGGSIGRPKRRDTCVNMLDGAVSAIEDRLGELEALEYGEDGKPKGASDNPYDPESEDDRDERVQELEQLRDELTEAKDTWDGVEFPGMFG